MSSKVNKFRELLNEIEKAQEKALGYAIQELHDEIEDCSFEFVMEIGPDKQLGKVNQVTFLLSQIAQNLTTCMTLAEEAVIEQKKYEGEK